MMVCGYIGLDFYDEELNGLVWLMLIWLILGLIIYFGLGLVGYVLGHWSLYLNF
jgi:hypothetical protein